MTFGMTFRNAVIAVCASVAIGALAATAAVAGETQTTGVQTDATLEKLRTDFRVLRDSLRNKGGIADADLPLIRAFQDRVEAYRNANPDNSSATGMTIAVAGWLEEHDKVFDLYASLAAQHPDKKELRGSWSSYFQRNKMPERVEEIYEAMFERTPNDPELRIEYATRLKQSSQYPRVIELLSEGDFDPAEHPEAYVMLSDALFAQEEYEQALETLNVIPEDVLTEKPGIKATIDREKPIQEEYVELWAAEQELRAAEASADDLPRAEIVTARGPIVVELFENQAPNTVANFISLAESDFYDGTTFHRVIGEFMSQGGDIFSKEGEDGVPGTGNPGYYLPDEHTGDNYRNHFTGSLAMAKTTAPNTAGSQFYISHKATPWLNGKHTVFGRVLQGLDIARSIQVDDMIEDVKILRKRDHEYEPQTIPLEDPDEEKPISSDDIINAGGDESDDEG